MVHLTSFSPSSLQANRCVSWIVNQTCACDLMTFISRPWYDVCFWLEVEYQVISSVTTIVIGVVVIMVPSNFRSRWCRTCWRVRWQLQWTAQYFRASPTTFPCTPAPLPPPCPPSTPSLRPPRTPRGSPVAQRMAEVATCSIYKVSTVSPSRAHTPSRVRVTRCTYTWNVSSFILLTCPFFPWESLVPHRWFSQPVSFICLCSPLPSRTWRNPGLSIHWCCLASSSSVCLVFFPFHCALKDSFGQTWWTGDMTIYYCSLCLFTMVRRSSCGPIVCWILAFSPVLFKNKVTCLTAPTVTCDWMYVHIFCSDLALRLTMCSNTSVTSVSN